MEWPEFTLYLSTTILSTFIGASAAFYLDRKQVKYESRKTHVGTGNRALFILNRQYGILKQIKNQIIDAAPNDPSNWLNIPATLPRGHEDLRFNIGDLGFLLESKSPNILNSLLLEEDRFFEALKTLNERSSYHRTVLQPKLARLNIENDKPYPATIIEDSLGKDTVGAMKTLTKALIEHVDEGLEGVQRIYGELREVLTASFPGERVIKIEFPANSVQPNNQADGK